MFSIFFAKERIVRGRNGRQRNFRQFNKKLTGDTEGENNFRKMQANTGILGERKKPFEEKQSRLAKMDGLKLKGDFEQRGSGRGNSENKAACFECGHRSFQGAMPNMDQKERKAVTRRKNGKWEKGNEKERKVSNVCVFRRRRNGPKK